MTSNPGAIESSDRPTDVCLTIDTEFSIAGAFSDPDSHAPIGDDYVMCPTPSGDSGLGFILRTLAESDLRATFFVETLNTTWFGDAPMGAVTERILLAGHDVQLHLHPCWLYFTRSDWQSRLAEDPPTDRCDGRELEDLAGLLARGVASLRGWGVPEVSAFRAGNLYVDRTVYDAMARVGLTLASNIGLGSWQPPDPALRLSCGRHWFDSVLELPVTSYFAPGPRGRRSPRLFTITGTSIAEAQYLLGQARIQCVSPVVILTHPFEFAYKAERGAAHARPHRVNRRRLRALCQFLANHRNHFRTRTFSEGAMDWRTQGAVDATDLTVPLSLAAARLLENKLADMLG